MLYIVGEGSDANILIKRVIRASEESPADAIDGFVNHYEGLCNRDKVNILMKLPDTELNLAHRLAEVTEYGLYTIIEKLVDRNIKLEEQIKEFEGGFIDSKLMQSTSLFSKPEAPNKIHSLPITLQYMKLKKSKIVYTHNGNYDMRIAREGDKPLCASFKLDSYTISLEIIRKDALSNISESVYREAFKRVVDNVESINRATDIVVKVHNEEFIVSADVKRVDSLHYHVILDILKQVD